MKSGGQARHGFKRGLLEARHDNQPAVFSVLIALAALAAIDARPSAAEVYRPWCVQYLGGFSGGTSCVCYSFGQCMETARGNGAYCYQNPWFLQYGGG
jgi:hypothetical protein